MAKSMTSEKTEKPIKIKKSQMLVNELNILLKDYSSRITLRQAYYRLVSKHIIDNTINEYKNLSRIKVKAQREGKLSYDAFVDRTRSITGTDWGSTYQDVDSEISSAIYSLESSMKPSVSFSYPRWHKQKYRVMVVSEKEALANIFESECNRSRVKFLVSKGYASETIKKEASDILKLWKTEGAIPIILHFGDFDPSGKDIARDIEKVMSIHGVNGFEFKTVSLTEKQIVEWKLPPMMTKKSDSRAKAFIEKYGEKSSVELDAVDPKLLSQLIRISIEEYFDPEQDAENKKDAREFVKKANKEVKKAVKKFLQDYIANYDEDAEDDSEDDSEDEDAEDV
jgi:hypothetical protein